MATSITTHLNGTNTNADFQNFVAAVHAAMVASGWTQAADTGQINPATVATPAAGASAGYEIWNMADTLQATKPVCIRLDYVNSPGQASAHGLWVTLGLGGTNGAGTLLSPKSVPLNAYPNGGVAAATYDLRMSGATNRIALFGGVGTPGNSYTSFGFSVERSHNDDGTDSSDGAFLTTKWTGFTFAPTNASAQNPEWDSQYVSFDNKFGANTGMSNVNYTANANWVQGQSRLPMPWYTGDGGSMLVGLSIGLMPLFMANYGVRDPSFVLCGYSTTDLSNDQTVSFQEYGATKTWRSMGTWLNQMDNAGCVSGGAQLYYVGGSAYHGCMMRWE